MAVDLDMDQGLMETSFEYKYRIPKNNFMRLSARKRIFADVYNRYFMCDDGFSNPNIAQCTTHSTI